MNTILSNDFEYKLAYLPPPEVCEVPLVCCPYCGKNALLIEAGGRYWRWGDTNVWVCLPCDAAVGAERQHNLFPTGELACCQTRKLRSITRGFFETVVVELLMDQGIVRPASIRHQQEYSNGSCYIRSDAYAWLKERMGREKVVFATSYHECEEILLSCASYVLEHWSKTSTETRKRYHKYRKDYENRQKPLTLLENVGGQRREKF